MSAHRNEVSNDGWVELSYSNSFDMLPAPFDGFGIPVYLIPTNDDLWSQNN